MVRKSCYISSLGHAFSFNNHYSICIEGRSNKQNHMVCAYVDEYINGKANKLVGNLCNMCDRRSELNFISKRLGALGARNVNITQEQFDGIAVVYQGNCKFEILFRYVWDYHANAVDYEFNGYNFNCYLGKGFVSADVRNYKAVVEHFRSYISGLDLVSISKSPRRL